MSKSLAIAYAMKRKGRKKMAEGGKVGGAKTSTTGNKTKTGGSNPGGASTGGAGTVTITTGKTPPESISISNVGGKTAARNPGGMDPSDENDSMMAKGGLMKSRRERMLEASKGNNMKDGGDVKKEGGLAKTASDFFTRMASPTPPPQTKEDKYEAIRAKNSENFGASHAKGGEVHSCSNCGYAEGGQITDNYQSPSTAMHQTHDGSVDEQQSGFMDHEGNTQRPNGPAMTEDGRRLGAHGTYEQGPYGVPPNSTKNPSKNPPYFKNDLYDRDSDEEASMMAEGGQVTDNYQKSTPPSDMVGRIMKQRADHYSKGGKVANNTGTGQESDGLPNQFDDLVLRDDLESTYGDDDNSGDAKGNSQEDEDRKDIVARIMASRRKKDRLPNPA